MKVKVESEYLKSERQRGALLQLVFILAEVAEVLRSNIQLPTRGRQRGSRGEPEEMQHLPPAPRNKCPVLWQRQGIPLSHTATGSQPTAGLLRRLIATGTAPAPPGRRDSPEDGGGGCWHGQGPVCGPMCHRPGAGHQGRR